jgi:hypothetical protein
MWNDGTPACPAGVLLSGTCGKIGFLAVSHDFALPPIRGSGHK